MPQTDRPRAGEPDWTLFAKTLQPWQREWLLLRLRELSAPASVVEAVRAA